MSKQQKQALAELIALRARLMASPPPGASLERVLAHYAGLVGEAQVGIDSAILKLTT